MDADLQQSSPCIERITIPGNPRDMVASLHREMALIEDTILTVAASGREGVGRLSCVTCPRRFSRQDRQAPGRLRGLCLRPPHGSGHLSRQVLSFEKEPLRAKIARFQRQ